MQWSQSTNQRQKLQMIYALVGIGSLIVAGLFSLVDRTLGLFVLNVAYIAGSVWLVNFVVWALYLAISSDGNVGTDVQPAHSKVNKK